MFTPRIARVFGLVLFAFFLSGGLASLPTSAQDKKDGKQVKSKLKITVPQDDAELMIDNKATKVPKDNPTVREFLTPDVVPGTLYYYTHCEGMLKGAVFMDVYTQRLLPLKLSLDRIYLRHANPLYDCRVMLRTVIVIVGRMLGIRRFPEPPELREAVSSLGSDRESLLRSV